jgi:4-amino-4-deoxy-L-arabinose transferase-like glycosyltransferase
MIEMGKKREDRGKEKKTQAEADCECNLDGVYTNPVRSLRDLTIGNIKEAISRSRYLQLLFFLTLIGAILRFYNLGYNSLWLDEATTYNIALKSIPNIWQVTIAGEFNPPLFYWIEHIMLIFGNSEVVLRFIPALLGVLTIPLFYLIGKEFIDRNVGIIAAAICTFSPFLLYYSQESRAYSLALFFVASAMVFFLKAMKTNKVIHWLFFGLLSALALWSHFYAMVVIGTLVLYALGIKIPEYRKDLRALTPLVAAGAVFTVICLPLIFVSFQLFTKRTSGGPSFGIQGADVIIETYRQLSGFSMIVMYLFLIFFIIGILQAFLIDRNKGIFLVTLTILPFAISWFLSYQIPMVPRYLIILTPVYFVGIALSYKPAFRLVSNRWVVYGFMTLLILLSITTPFFMSYYSSYTKEDWRGFSSQVGQVAQPGDFIVLVPGYMTQPFDYYYTNATKGTFEYGASSAEQLAAISALKANNTIYYVVTGDISSADTSGGSVTWLQGHAKGAEATSGIYLFKYS